MPEKIFHKGTVEEVIKMTALEEIKTKIDIYKNNKRIQPQKILLSLSVWDRLKNEETLDNSKGQILTIFDISYEVSSKVAEADGIELV